MKIKSQSYRYFNLTALASSVLLLSTGSYALQALDEQGMRQVDGQDGISLTTNYDRIDIDQVYWEDKTGSADNTEKTLRGYANNVSITPNNVNEKLGTTIEINAGSNALKTAAGMDLKVKSTIGTIAAESFNICDGNGANCGASFGNMAIQSSTPAEFHFSNQNGLFSENAEAELLIGLRDLNIYLGQKETANATTQNQLIMKNFNFNFFGKGNLFVDDAGGLVLRTGPTGYVDFNRVADPSGNTGGTFNGTHSGLNLEFMHKSNAGIGEGTYSLDGAKGIIRAGASGRIVNAYLRVRGIDAKDSTNNILGYATNGTSTGSGTNATILGSTGIAFRLRGDFTRDQADADLFGAGGSPTTLELGGAGKNAYGVEFGKLTPLLTRSVEGGALNTGRAYFDSGDIYISLANTKHMALPVNTVLNNARLGNTRLTTTSEYTQQIHDQATNPNSLIMAVRGMEFQALSRQARFTVSNDVTDAALIPDPTPSEWGIGLPIYDLNANIATYGTTYSGTLADGTTVNNSERLGFAASLSTTGRDATGSKTTSILIIDGGKNANDGNNPTDQYVGLRNIDMYLSGRGSIGVESGKLNVRMPNLIMAMSAEVAAGYLPGAKYKTCPTGGGSCYSPINNFAKNTDVLFGIKLKFAGDMNFSIIPSEAETLGVSGNKISFVGSYDVTNGAIQITEPVDGSILGLDNLSGKIGFNNAIVVDKDNAAFNLSFTFNPDRDPAKVFRAKDINFYGPDVNKPAQRLGEMVITGGTLSSSMKITPFN